MVPRLPLELVEMIIDDVVAEFDNDDDNDNHDIDNHFQSKLAVLSAIPFSHYAENISLPLRFLTRKRIHAPLLPPYMILTTFSRIHHI